MVQHKPLRKRKSRAGLGANRERKKRKQKRAEKTAMVMAKDTTAITMQFPVSSGQVHRLSERKETSLLSMALSTDIQSLIPFQHYQSSPTMLSSLVAVAPKCTPGQFTGSTGAQVLPTSELKSGRQLWVRRDQMSASKPVTSGLGMTLLQKMGWKPGEGLGPTKTGSLQPLLPDIKLDKRGLISSEDVTRTSRQAITQRKSKEFGRNTLNTTDKHPVCMLNELVCKYKWPTPQYVVRNYMGPAHSPMYILSVEINGKSYTPEESSNTKKEAKYKAAKLCLQKLGLLPAS